MHVSWIPFFKGQCLLFLPNVAGATFFQGATSIPQSTVIFKLIPVLTNQSTTMGILTTARTSYNPLPNGYIAMLIE